MGQMFQISKFPDTHLFVIILRMIWWNIMKIGQIYILYKFTRSSFIPSKIKRQILASKGSQTTHHTRRLSHLLKLWINWTTFWCQWQWIFRFSGKTTHCRQGFFILVPQWSIEDSDKIMSKVAKSKGKTRSKNGIARKCAKE